MTVTNLEDVAIVIRPECDNLAVVTADVLEPGTELRYPRSVAGDFRPRTARSEFRRGEGGKGRSLHHPG